MSHEQCRDTEGGRPGTGRFGPRHWAVLREVSAAGGSRGLASVARALASRECEPEETVTRTRYLYTELHDRQLVDLVDAGLVTYCTDEGVVALTDRGEAVLSDTRVPPGQ